MHKKLYRSRDYRMLSGVLGGLGEYFAIDPIIIRIVFILILIATGIFPAIIAYIIAALVVPEAPHITHSTPIEDDDPAI